MSENSSPSQSGSPTSADRGNVIIIERTVENLVRDEINEFLIERMNPDFGICDKLRSCGVLKKAEYDDIENLQTPAKRNSRLLEIIKGKKKYQEFLNALRDTDQGHLVNYITGNGEYSDEYLLMWPLTDREINILESNREYFLLHMVAEGGLIDHLFAYQVINFRQKSFLDGRNDGISKTKALLDILYCSSLKDYMLMIKSLDDTYQGHVATVLREGGELVPVHNALNVNDEAEMELVHQIRGLLGNRSLGNQVRIMELTLLGASKGSSIILYFWCQKVEELLNLQKFLHNGELKKRIESFFNRFTTGISNITVISTLPSEVFERCKASLEAAKNRQDTLDPNILSLCENFSSLEAHIQQMEGQDKKMEENKEEEVAKSMKGEKESERVELRQTSEQEESVKVELRKTSEQSPVCIRPTGIEIMADILRNNTEYLLDNMCTKGLLDKVHVTKCLSDEETRYIKTLVRDMDKNEEILKVIRNGSLDTYNKFVDALRHTDQHIIAEVLKRGGVVVKAAVTIDEEQENSERIKEELVKSINQLLSKNGPVKPQLLHFFCLLKRNGLDILSAKQEKDIILWIWCTSKAALEQLHKTNESDTVLENFNKILTGLFRLLLDDNTEITDIDMEDTDRRFVCHTPCSKHLRDLQIASQNVCGIAELDGKFYILSKNPSKINEFESLDSTDSETWILSSVKDPAEIVSSDKHHCLYVSDAGSSSIWKATAHDRKVTQWLENISNPFTMSLTKDEHVLLVRRDQPATIEVYDSNAKQIFCVALPSNIGRPIHAVESLTGSFFISFRGENEGQSGICEMTKNGDTVSIFDSSITHVEDFEEDINEVLCSFVSNSFSCCYPEYLALDHQGNLYATDSLNKRVMVLDGRLNLESILEEDFINMHLTKFQKQMMVLHGVDHMMRLIDIQQ